MAEEHIEGLAALDAALAELPQRIAKGAAQRVLRRGAEPIRRAWEGNARVREREQGHGPKGRFKKSIAVSSQAAREVRQQAGFQGTPAAVAFVGPTHDGYPEAMFEEFGAPAHNEAANAPGRRAWEAEKNEALRIIAAELGPEIEKTAARLAKRSGS